MDKKRVLVLLGNPSNETFCGALAEAYIDSAKKAGAEIRYTRLADLEFDPNLKLGYKSVQSLEPDLVQFQKDLLWAEHFVLFFPMWWGGFPGNLQGLFDRTFLPGFAFKFHEGKMLQEKLLKGRSAHAFITMDSPNWYYRLFLGAPLSKRLKKQVLKFCGFDPVKITILGGVGQAKKESLDKMLASIQKFGSKIA